MDQKDIIIQEQAQKIAELEEKVQMLTSLIAGLQEDIREYRRQLGQDSHNSSCPPSGDKYKNHKIKKSHKRNLRNPSGKKQGAQNGHRGTHMEIPHDPDVVKQHFPAKCQSCPHLEECAASGSVFRCGEKRYEVDVVITTKVTEHQSLKVYNCPCGETGLNGEFPESIKGYVQYGSSIIILAGLLNTYGAISIERIHILLSSLLGVRISTGTITAMIGKCAKKVENVLKKIKKMLIWSDVVNFDETGVNVNGKTIWVHNSSTPELTYQTINPHRGQAGMEGNGVLPGFIGVGVHDCYSPYWKYDMVTHAVCNAHILRELIGVEEYSPEHTWAPAFKNLLLDMKKAKEQAIEKGEDAIQADLRAEFNAKYDEILALADQECPALAKENKRKGRQKKGKERSLIERLRKLKGSICLFLDDFQVPFDNNQAERDVRNTKTKCKVSGYFRTEEGAKKYLDIMSFISTGAKHSITAFEALTAAFSGNAEIVLE